LQQTTIRNVGLVTGNGLTLDFCHRNNLIQARNPSDPFSWKFSVPTRGGLAPWQEGFPVLWDEIQHHGHIASFSTFVAMVRSPKNDFIHLFCEAMHFLAMAYSDLQGCMDLVLDDDWPWLRWLDKYSPRLSSAISFNYDNLLERSLDRLQIPRWPSWSQEREGVSIHKPHGSIELDASPAMRMNSRPYPLQSYAHLVDCPIVEVPAAKLLKPRNMTTIVMPSECSVYANYQWVAPGYRQWQEKAQYFSHCVFLGLSYWECDRPELDFLLDSLGAQTTVVVANRSPPSAFADRVAQRGLKYVEWPSGPQLLPCF
jgi:hypothetical protein